MTGGPTPPAAPEPRERPRPQVEPPATRRLASYGGPDVGQEMRRAEQDRLVAEAERRKAIRQAEVQRQIDAARAGPPIAGPRPRPATPAEAPRTAPAPAPPVVPPRPVPLQILRAAAAQQAAGQAGGGNGQGGGGVPPGLAPVLHRQAAADAEGVATMRAVAGAVVGLDGEIARVQSQLGAIRSLMTQVNRDVTARVPAQRSSGRN